MKLSTRSTYGLRAMMTLASNYGQGPMLLKNIASIETLPVTYLEQLMVPLRKAALIFATRGVNGGYILSRPPEEISLGEVIKILEGKFELVDCAGVVQCKAPVTGCALKEVLNQAGDMLTTFFDGISLAELARKDKVISAKVESLNEAVLSYHI